MNTITFQLRDIHEKKVVVVLPKKPPNLQRVLYFIGIIGVFSILLFLIINSLGPTMFYGLILDIVLFIVALIGIIYGWYGLVNTLYEQPIMILTPENIFLGNKLLFRSPYVKTSGIIPKEDLQLIIVRDSKSNHYKLYLEGRKILQLGIYKTINEAKNQRRKLRQFLADFYPHIYISMPRFQEI